MYGTLELANAYFTTERLDRQGVWANATSDNRTACLNEARRLIDNLNFKGCKTEDDQVEEFPRDGSDTVPDDIIHANYEVAYQILSGRDVDIELENIDKVSVAFGNRRVSKGEPSLSEAKTNAIPSERAWKLLKPYLRDPYKLKIERTS